MTAQLTLPKISHWIVFADLGRFGVASADATPIFDDACSRFADHMEQGEPAAVYRLDFATGSLVDVTAEALARVNQWLAARGDDQLCGVAA